MTNHFPISVDESRLSRIINFLENGFEGIIVNDLLDRKFFTFLMLDFSELDIEEELKQYQAWTLDQKNHGQKINHRSRFRLWLKRAVLMQKRN